MNRLSFLKLIPALLTVPVLSSYKPEQDLSFLDEFIDEKMNRPNGVYFVAYQEGTPIGEYCKKIKWQSDEIFKSRIIYRGCVVIHEPPKNLRMGTLRIGN